MTSRDENSKASEEKVKPPFLNAEAHISARRKPS
jgi:hypothetical protein